MASQPVDFLSGLGGIGALPHPYDDQQQVVQDQQRQQLGAQAIQQNQQVLAQQQAAQQQQQQFHSDVMALGDNPTPAATAGLIRKYPDFAKQLSEAHNIQDEAKRNADFKLQSQIYAAAQNGRYDLASSLLKSHRDASVKAGEPADPSDEAIITALDSGDPAEQKRALSMIGLSVASINPDKFSETYKVLNPTDGEQSTVVNAGGALVDKRTGKVLYQAGEKGDLREIKVTDPTTGQETTQFVRVGGTEGGGPASSGGAPSGSGGAPLSTRLNNPGAIRFDSSNNWQGQVGQQDGFVQFDTPANGARAHQKLIANQLKSGHETPLTWAQHYAPASDGNDPQAYAQTIAQGLGIGVNDKIPLSAVPKMAQLSARVEAGGTPARGASPAQSGVVASYVTKPGSGSTVDPNLSGPAVLKALPPPMAARVQQLLDGRSLLTSREKATPQGQALLNAANQADPLYDEASAPARVQAFKQFTGNGKAAQVAASGNRLAYHLNDLYRDSLALSGPDTGFSPLNTALAASGQAFQPAAAARYDAVLPFISGELQKLTKNGTSTEGETKIIMGNLSRRQSASTRAAAIQQVVELAEGQFKPFRDQYQSVFGGDKSPPVDFTPTTAKIFDHIKNGDAPLTIDGNGHVVEPKGAASGPVQVRSRAEALALPPGTPFIDPQGHHRVRP